MKRKMVLRPSQTTTKNSRVLDLFLTVVMAFAFFLAIVGEFYSLPWVNPDNFWVDNMLFLSIFLFPPYLITQFVIRNRTTRLSGYFKSKTLFVILMTVGFGGLLSSLCFFGAGTQVGVADETRMTEKGLVYIGRDGNGPTRNISRELTRDEYYRRKSYASGFGFGLALFLSSVTLADRLIKKKK